MRDGHLDADGPAGVDFLGMGEALDYGKGHGGRTPESFESWQAGVFPGQDERGFEVGRG